MTNKKENLQKTKITNSNTEENNCKINTDNCDKEDKLFDFDKLENMKKKIESMNKNHQIEILKILKNDSSVKINENKSGIFINLTFLPIEILKQIEFYLNYVHDQEYSLQQLESQKKEFKDHYFMEINNSN